MPQNKNVANAENSTKPGLNATTENNCVVFCFDGQEWHVPTLNQLRQFIKSNCFSAEEIITALCAEEQTCKILFNRAYHVAEFSKMFPQHLKLLCEQKVLRKLMDKGYVVADMIAASPKDADYLLNEREITTNYFSGSDVAQIVSARPDLAQVLCETYQLGSNINNETDLINTIKAAPSLAKQLVINQKKYHLLETAEGLFSLVKIVPQYAKFLLQEKGLYCMLAKGKAIPEEAHALLCKNKLSELDPDASKIANINQKIKTSTWQQRLSGWMKRKASV